MREHRRPVSRKKAGSRGKWELRTLLNKHKRSISLLGALIVFSTFVTKDAIREHVKSTVDALQSAEDVFEIRGQHEISVAMLNSVSQHVDEVWKTTPGRAEYLKKDERSELDYDFGEIKNLILQVEANIDILSRLVDTLPRRESLVRSRLTALKKRYQSLNDSYTKVALKVGKRAISEEEEDGWLYPFGTESENLLADVGALSAKARERCEAVKHTEEKSLRIFTWLSYALYAIGWCLTLFGRLFEDDALILDAE